MPFSQWLKIDLHIHSHVSKKTKTNDYDGVDLTYEHLITALQKEKVNIFSITDHNTINKSIYLKLLEEREALQSLNMNFIIGAEVDFFDEEIHDKEFHMLVYFDTYDLEVVENIFKTLYAVNSFEEIGLNVRKISVNDFFKITFSNGIKNIITIPHFGNKDKGLPVKDEIDAFVYTVFNALEDSNNRMNLLKSLKVFKKYQYNDVPLVIFSDNHNISKYPLSKNGDVKKQTFTHILGNIEFPFSSLKTAFQDVNTRICIENVDGTRQIDICHRYINEIIINDNLIVKLSPYQNTVIGGFGSGKSFLLNLILSGSENVNESYKELIKRYNNFKIRMSDGAIRNSLSEVENDIKILRFEQHKNIYFESYINEEYRMRLENDLFIEFPNLDPIQQYETNLLECFNLLSDNMEKSKKVTDIFNYGILTSCNTKSFSFSTESVGDIVLEDENSRELCEMLEKERYKKILGCSVYDKEEIGKISNVIDMIRKKYNLLHKTKVKTDEILSTIYDTTSSLNSASSSQNELLSTSLEIIKNIKSDILSYIENISKFKNSADAFEKHHSSQVFLKFKETSKENIFFDYRLVAMFDAKEDEVSLNKIVLIDKYRNNGFFQGVIETIHGSESHFSQKKSFAERIEKFNKTFYANFKEIRYDIIENDMSVFKKSAGEKANVIMDIIFCKVKDFSDKNINSIVLLDQPEDHLDS